MAKWKNAVSLAPTQWRYCIFALCFVFPDFPRASIPTCLPGRPCKSPQNSRSLGNEIFIPCQDVPCLSCTLSTDVPTGYTEVMANMETASFPWEMRLWYSAVPLQHDRFSLKSSTKSPHSSPVRARYILWIQILIYIRLQSLQCWVQYPVILDGVITALDCITLVNTNSYQGYLSYAFPVKWPTGKC